MECRNSEQYFFVLKICSRKDSCEDVAKKLNLSSVETKMEKRFWINSKGGGGEGEEVEENL